MNNLRIYGTAPYRLAVIHGGPGAPGEMVPMARELSPNIGVLEPLQTADSINGQVAELKNVLEKSGNPPITLIGFSWGGWLSFIFAARHPSMVKKLIFVSSGPFDEKYVAQIMETRFKHLNADEKNEALLLFSTLDSACMKGNRFIRFGELMDKADSFDSLPHDSETLPGNPDIYQKVWAEASKIRRSRKLLNLGKMIRCPVVAIHGDYDPHPAVGVQEPLSRVLQDFRFILLEKCGHHPWFERQAKQQFYDVLGKEIEQMDD
jgi:pimeloyl-ACP methyl ester carboxylesterase